MQSLAGQSFALHELQTVCSRCRRDTTPSACELHCVRLYPSPVTGKFSASASTHHRMTGTRDRRYKRLVTHAEPLFCVAVGTAIAWCSGHCAMPDGHCLTFCCSGGSPQQPWSSGLAPVLRFHSSVPLSPLVPVPSRLCGH